MVSKNLLKKFCPRCGKDSEKLFEGFCEQCFFEKKQPYFFPEKISIEKCGRCAKIRFKGKWFEENPALLHEILELQLKSRDFEPKLLNVEFEEIDEKNFLATAIIALMVEESVFRQEKESLLFFQPTICDACMRTTSYYFESTVQIRFDKKKFSKKESDNVFEKISKIMAIEHKSDSLAKIVDVKSQKTGFDVLIGSRKAGKKVAKAISAEFNAEVKNSYTLVGLDKTGKEKMRHTYCIRIKN